MMDRRRLLMLAPLVGAVAAGGGFWAMLQGLKSGTFDPRGVPSPIVGQRAPAFDLPDQAPGRGFSSADLASGRPLLLNFFASWCVPCAQEHPNLMALQRTGLPIWAIAYKDGVDKAEAFIRTHGDPYARIGRDAPGRVAIDWGISGVPESFLVDATGTIRWHWAGPLDADTIQARLEPALRALA